MKGLSQFLGFDWNSFEAGKIFIVTGISENKDYNTKAHLGSKVECVIATDNTQYKSKNGEKITNRFEKIVFKVTKDIDIPLDSRVKPVNAVATIYGDYRNQLSVKCDDIVVVQAKDKG